MVLGEKIAMLRKQKGWSQEELAEKLEISRQSVSKWESLVSIPDLDKILKLGEMFHVSTDYLLKDAMEEPERTGNEEACEHVSKEREEEMRKYVSMEEAEGFMELTRRLAGRFALGVALCILCPICLILLTGLVEYGYISLSEDMAGGIGTGILLLLVAVGVGILVFAGITMSRYNYMEKESLALACGVGGVAEKRKQEFIFTYRKCIALGVMLCIAGSVPLIITAGIVREDGFAVHVCVAVLLTLVACGVGLFVWAGSIYGGYQKLLQEEDYTEENKAINRKIEYFPGVYWCLVTALFLGISFCYDSWKTSWIVWPVAGVLFAALYLGVREIARNRMRRR